MATAFSGAAAALVDHVAANAQDSTVGAATCKAVAAKHLPTLLGDACAAPPLAAACTAARWLAPLVRRAAEAEDGDVQGDVLVASLLKAPHADDVAIAVAAQAAADAEDAAGALAVLPLLRCKALPPAAVAALASMVPQAEGGVLESLRAMLPPEALPMTLVASPIGGIVV